MTTENETPRDVVERRGLTRETVAFHNARQKDDCLVVSEPGRVSVGVDGIPTGVDAPTTTPAQGMFLYITRDEANRLELTEDEVSNVRIVD